MIAKLRAISDGLLSEARVAQIVEAVDRLPKLADVSRLAALLAPPLESARWLKSR